MNDGFVPDSFNDDLQIYYLDRLTDMLDGRLPMQITNDHVQALMVEATMTDESISKKLYAVQRQLKVPKKHFNDFSKFHYRKTDDIYEAIKPLLATCGCVLTLANEPVLIGDRIYIKSTATFTDGKDSLTTTAYAREPALQKGMTEAQLTLAVTTLANKTVLGNLLLLDDSEDIDSTDNTLPPPVDPEILQILELVKHNDVIAVHHAWGGIITKHWNQLAPDITDKLNQMIETPLES